MQSLGVIRNLIEKNTVAEIDIEELEIYPEEEISPEIQHQSLQVLAEEEIDGGDELYTDPETIEMIS